MRQVVVVITLLGLLSSGTTQAQEHAHDGKPSRSSAPAGYKPEKSVTRYELAVALFQLLSHIDAAAKQPSRTLREVKPGRKAPLAPDSKKIRPYSDVPKDHWAKGSLAGLQARGFSLVPGQKFQGDKALTGNELATWVDGLVGWTEGRAPKAKQLKDLVQMGYLPQTSPLLKKSALPVTAREVSDVLTQVIVRAQEKVTTISPDSKHAN